MNTNKSLVLRPMAGWPTPEERQELVVKLAKLPELASTPLAVTVRTLADYDWNLEAATDHLLRLAQATN